MCFLQNLLRLVLLLLRFLLQLMCLLLKLLRLELLLHRFLLSAPDIDVCRMKDLFQSIFLSSDTDNEDLEELVYDYLNMSRLTGDFSPPFTIVDPVQ